MIRGNNVSWGVRDKVIVDGVTLAVRRGSTVGLLGPNGSGKSSLLRVIAGLRPASSGVITLGDDDLAALSRRQIARRMAVVDQEVTTDTQPTVRDVISLGRLPHRAPWSPSSSEDRAIVDGAAASTRTSELLDRPYSTLSGGERQRVQIARALAQQPSELLLDEPTNHLDIRHQLELLELVRAADTTTLVALHDLNLAAAYCDEVVVMCGGRVRAAGRPRDVLTADLIADVYEVDAAVSVVDGVAHIRFLGVLS
ncbi:ABC transporter ATP-binding protein [Cumulibacter soli]|uniref:ABC transporter ATP-binding protein n=1 Tax=Cumulibacter soli TaxID=2546344 RepID=UPI001067F291|nr:ABC transporter ATP-binding protein [Cumulibacter soli]